MKLRLIHLFALALLGTTVAAAAENQGIHLNIKDCESSALLSGLCPAMPGQHQRLSLDG